MRTIKFRGKDIIHNKWLYGLYMPPFKKEDTISYIYEIVECENHFEYISTQVTTESVGQFTGLVDNNGVEIYDGDILELDGVYIVIIYNEKEAAYYAKSKKSEFRIWQELIDDFKLKVVGNIYDIPELINKKDK